MTASEDSASKRLNRKEIYRAFADGVLLTTSRNDSGEKTHKKLQVFKHSDMQAFSKIGHLLV